MEWSQVVLWAGLLLLWGAVVIAILALLSAGRGRNDGGLRPGGDYRELDPGLSPPATVIGRYRGRPD
jgi:hypothetical protein